MSADISCLLAAAAEYCTDVLMMGKGFNHRGINYEAGSAEADLWETDLKRRLC